MDSTDAPLAVKQHSKEEAKHNRMETQDNGFLLARSFSSKEFLTSKSNNTYKMFLLVNVWDEVLIMWKGPFFPTLTTVSINFIINLQVILPIVVFGGLGLGALAYIDSLNRQNNLCNKVSN